MKKHSSIHQPALLLMAIAMITGCVVAGIGLVWTNQLSAQAGQDIRKLEQGLRSLNDENAKLEYQMRTVTEQISLQKLAERHFAGQLHRLDPTGDQVVVVPRTGLLPSSPRISSTTVGDAGRFQVMDLACMIPSGEQDNARQ